LASSPTVTSLRTPFKTAPMTKWRRLPTRLLTPSSRSSPGPELSDKSSQPEPEATIELTAETELTAEAQPKAVSEPFKSKAEKVALVTKHRRALADVLESLDEAEWNHPSLCDGWDIRHVVGHLLTPALSPSRRTAVTVAKSGSYTKAFDRLAREFGEQSPAELLKALREHADNVWVSPIMGAAAPLTDILVHSQDIVRPLGIELTVDPLEVDPALTFVVGNKSNQLFVKPKRYAGLRLIATDLKWKVGKGAELEGPAIELLLAVMGRGVALKHLSGPGFDLLSERI
jgi:uncharacterized protein (TIGR03083 family)